MEEKLQAGKTFDIYYGAGAMDVCQFTPQRPCTYFTIVRDPINRILSGIKSLKAALGSSF